MLKNVILIDSYLWIFAPKIDVYSASSWKYKTFALKIGQDNFIFDIFQL